jgi:hypothetical protein
MESLMEQKDKLLKDEILYSNARLRMGFREWYLEKTQKDLIEVDIKIKNLNKSVVDFIDTIKPLNILSDTIKPLNVLSDIVNENNNKEDKNEENKNKEDKNEENKNEEDKNEEDKNEGNKNEEDKNEEDKNENKKEKIDYYLSDLEKLHNLKEDEMMNIEDDNKKYNLWIITHDKIINSNNGYITEIITIILELKLQQVVIEKKQLALKVSANSMYGFLGVQIGGLMPLIEGAMSVTAMGRILIGEVNKWAEKKYNATIVYNDTDSSFINLNLKDTKECEYWGNRLAEEISGTKEKKLRNGKIIPAKKGLFPPPLRMEFEKAMRVLCLRKKKYAAYLIEDDGSFEIDDDGQYYILKKGITIARRDNCQFMRDTYTKLLRCILNKEPMSIAFKIIIDSITKLLRNEIDPKDLVIIRELGSDYKNANYFMKVHSCELARMGKPVQAGDRLEYVVAKTIDELKGYETKLGLKMRNIDMFKDSWKTHNAIKDGTMEPLSIEDATYMYPAENIDFIWYIGHAIMNPLDQLFNIAYKNELKDCHIVGYKPVNSNCRYCSIITPVKMLCKIIEDKMKGYRQYNFPELDKFKEITLFLDTLPALFEERLLQLPDEILQLKLQEERQTKINAEVKLLQDANNETKQKEIDINEKLQIQEQIEYERVLEYMRQQQILQNNIKSKPKFVISNTNIIPIPKLNISTTPPISKLKITNTPTTPSISKFKITNTSTTPSISKLKITNTSTISTTPSISKFKITTKPTTPSISKFTTPSISKFTTPSISKFNTPSISKFNTPSISKFDNISIVESSDKNNNFDFSSLMNYNVDDLELPDTKISRKLNIK